MKFENRIASITLTRAKRKLPDPERARPSHSPLSPMRVGHDGPDTAACVQTPSIRAVLGLRFGLHGHYSQPICASACIRCYLLHPTLS